MPKVTFLSSLFNEYCFITSTSQQLYDLGFSFFSFHNADRPTPDTLTTLNRTPGMSPFALPLRPNPAKRTSSFSSTKFKQPSLGTVFGVSDFFAFICFFFFFLSFFLASFCVEAFFCLIVFLFRFCSTCSNKKRKESRNTIFL